MVISYKVYVHINKINGKLYIGQTSEDNPENRYKNGKNYMRCPCFYNAILKYGWDNFEHVVLVVDLTKELANIVEIELIKKYKTINNKYGYNLQLGGSGGKHNETTRLKMSINHADVSGENNPMYHKNHSFETKIKMSENRPSYVGENNPNYGKKCSKLAKEKSSDVNSKPVLQMDDNEKLIKRWNSASEAGRELKISIGNISRVCVNLRGTAGGFRWKFENETRDENEINFVDKRKMRTRAIIQKTKDGKVVAKYDSIKEAQEKTNVTSIANCLCGRYKSAGGYIWEYLEVI